MSGSDGLRTGGGIGLRRRLRRLRKGAQRRALYWVLCLAVPLIRLLPWEMGCALGRWMGDAAFLLAKRERELAIEHLSWAFPDRFSEVERRRLCRRMFRMVGQGAIEFVLLPRRFGPALARMVDGEKGAADMAAVLAEGKGTVILTGHVGNWELLGAWSAYLFPANVVARKIYYEPFDRIMVRMRARLGMKTIYRDASPREMLRALKRNEIVAILADQDVSDVQGVFVDFFGRPAYTPTGPVSLALHSGAPMLLVFVVREGRRFRTVSERFDLVRTGDRKEDLQLNTQRWTKYLEDLISRYPDQWPWYHRRWKTDEQVLERKRRQRRAGRRPRR